MLGESWDGTTLLSPQWIEKHDRNAWVVSKVSLGDGPDWHHQLYEDHQLGEKRGWWLHREILYLDADGYPRAIGRMWLRLSLHGFALMLRLFLPRPQPLGVHIRKKDNAPEIEVVEGPSERYSRDEPFWSDTLRVREVKRVVRANIGDNKFTFLTEEVLRCG